MSTFLWNEVINFRLIYYDEPEHAVFDYSN